MIAWPREISSQIDYRMVYAKLLQPSTDINRAINRWFQVFGGDLYCCSQVMPTGIAAENPYNHI